MRAEPLHRPRPDRARGGPAACSLAIVLAIVLAMVFGSLPATAAANRRAEPRLLHLFDRWLDEVGDLMSAAELEVFRALDSDAERERFVRAFWSARGDGQLERFAANRRAADAQRVRSRDERRAILLAGKPTRRWTLAGCAGRQRDLVLWEYSAWAASHQAGRRLDSFFLVYVQTSRFDPRTSRLWSPRSGTDLRRSSDAIHDDLSAQPETRRCPERGAGGGAPPAARIRRALESAVGFSRLATRLGWRLPDPGWLERFAAPGAAVHAKLVEDLTSGAGLRSELVPGVELDGRLIAVDGIGYLESRLSVPTRLLRLHSHEVVLDRLSVIGDLYRDDRLVDTFTVDFIVVGADPATPTVVLPFYRRVRPGRYRLRVRAADSRDLALLRADSELYVPETLPAGEPIVESRQSLDALSRSEVISLRTFPRLELLDPGPDLVGSTVTIAAVATGGSIAAVAFSLDGKPLGRDDQPPYEVVVPLSTRAHRLRAVAFDRHGQAVVTRELVVERPVTAFAIELLRAPGSAEAPVRIVVPDSKTLERIDCYWNDQRRATLLEPPFACPLPATPTGKVPYVRAVATTTDGDRVEDLVFLTPRGPEQVEVQLVEVYLSILDGSGRPVLDLRPEEVEVEEGGRPQQVESLRSIANLSLNVAVLMDISSSLGRGVRAAARSAQEFFSQVLRDGDLASLLVFNHDVEQAVAFTGDVEALRYGAIGLQAHGATRLYDALAFSFFTFSGLDGRRALVALTDGNDTDSDLAFSQVLEQARLARVSVYPIALGRVSEATREELRRLAATTGGRFFRVESVTELDRIYREIENELRSQYQLIYRPSRAERIRDLDDLEVRVRRPGIRASRLRSGN